MVATENTVAKRLREEGAQGEELSAAKKQKLEVEEEEKQDEASRSEEPTKAPAASNDDDDDQSMEEGSEGSETGSDSENDDAAAAQEQNDLLTKETLGLFCTVVPSVLTKMENPQEQEEESEGPKDFCLQQIDYVSQKRIFTGIYSWPLLQEECLGSRCYENVLGEKDLADLMKTICDGELVAKEVQSDLGYSGGNTFFIKMSEKPQNIAEKFAQEIFKHHTKEVQGIIEPKQSGAEFWGVACEEGADVAMHFDKDYNMEEAGYNTHPMLGTVTYLTSYGPPTMVVSVEQPYEKRDSEGQTYYNFLWFFCIFQYQVLVLTTY